MIKEEEALLIQRATQRDIAAWSSLYEAHYDDLYAYAYSRLVSREDAEDVASQVFVEALKGVERFAREYAKRQRPVLGWLLGIARTLTNDRQRRNELAIRQVAFAVVSVEAGDTDVVVERLDLHMALRHLTDEQQEVLILRYFMSKTTPEIAEIMGRKENAVFALQFRAVRSLRRYLSAGETAQVLRMEGDGS